MPKRRRHRLDRGAGMNSMGLIIIGLVFIVLGSIIKGQPWTTPEMFAGLGLDVGKLVVNVGGFLIFVQIINEYFYSPLREAMDSRNNELEATFSEAESLRSQLTEMRSDYETRLKSAEAEAREQIQSTIREAQALRDQLRADAVQQAEALKQQALAEIDQEKHKILTDLRLHVVNLTLQATERLVGESVDDAKSRKLVEEFIEKVEATA